MSTEKYRSDSQQRLIKTIFVLAGHEIKGLAPSDIIRATGMSASQVTRTMTNMEIGGIAEKMPDMVDRWRLAPRFVQISVAMLNGISKAQDKLEESRQRFTRNPS